MVYSESRIVARYAETDQMGVVHHAVYPIWYEIARTDYIKNIGLTYSEMERLGVMTPVVELSCRYRGSALYEDVVIVRVHVSELTAARIRFEYELFKEGETAPFHTGSTLHGWVDTKTFRPVNLKRAFPEIYQKIDALCKD